uniref:Uncharacterized protein n=1 Tax=Kalanchoe fedtschenkoi TaxID=63787 RepID=A0A7N0U8G1_KALFE
MDVLNVWLADRGWCFPWSVMRFWQGSLFGENSVSRQSVMCEVFLLSLSLECCSEVPRLELQKHLHQQAVQVIAGFSRSELFGLCR